jgi:hypothetical protein
MNKKDVEEIKKKPLGGRLLHEINEYKNSCVVVETKKLRDEIELNKNPVNNWDAKSVYPRGSVID